MPLGRGFRSSRTHSLTVLARKSFLSRARKQAVKCANFCNLVTGCGRFVLLAPMLAVALQGQYPGPVSRFGIHPTDVYAAFKLPAPQDAQGSALAIALAALQVGNRAKALGLSSASATNAWQTVQTILDEQLSTPAKQRGRKLVVFSGTSASALNQIIANAKTGRIRIVSPALTVDQPIEIQRGDLTLDLGTAQITSANSQSYMLRVENTANVSVQGGNFASGDSAILVNTSREVDIDNVQMSNLTGAGIVVTGSTRVNILGNRITALSLAGIMIHRNTTQSLVENNQIVGGAGFSNWMAGIVVTDREVDLTTNPRAIFGPDGYWVITQPMMQRLNPPHDNLIAWNSVSSGLASGIYVDGGVRTVIFSNFLDGNSKEGLCLDNGSTANVVASNTIYDNGQRWGDPDSILALDSILAGGRLPDGTAAEKVPGISLDNAVYNIVLDNNVAHNFGGGVKIVRTGYFNAIGLNNILDDNDGAGSVFHFFGIELGAASGSSPELDFTPSRGNVVFSNVIRGTHYSGIYFDPGSDNNNVLYNVILDATSWALESATQMMNDSVNNLTNLPSRNIGSGLDSALVTEGQAVNDSPY
jgi:parallel beta-helix repeat protein